MISLACVCVGGWVWSGYMIFVNWLGLRELNRLMQAKQLRPSIWTVQVTGFTLMVLATIGKARYLMPVVTLGILISFIRHVFRKPPSAMADIAATLLAIFYMAYMPAHFILLRNLDAPLFKGIFLEPGAVYAIFTLIVVAMSDVGAYTIGKWFGKSPLYPEISPKKTREGALGGLLLSVLLGCLYAHTVGIPFEHALTLGILLSVTAQLGDLSESLMKRDAGVKDSGVLVPGHGGILDRIDSYLFSGAVSYYYIVWVILGQGLWPNLWHDMMPYLKGWF